MSVLANNVDWVKLDPEKLQRLINNPREAGVAFENFLLSDAVPSRRFDTLDHKQLFRNDADRLIEVCFITSCKFTQTSDRYRPGLFQITGTCEEGTKCMAISLGTISTDDAEKKISKMDKRPMNYAEALRWFAANPNEEGWFVALGATCTVTEGGREIPCALVLDRDGSRRGLGVSMLAGDWCAYDRFLVVDKEPKKQNK